MKDSLNSFRFASKFGAGVIGGTAMLSGFLINNHFRYKLKLGNYGRMSSYLAVVAAPAMMSALLHATVSSS